MFIERKVPVNFPDVLMVSKNRYGVEYLYNMYNESIVAKTCTVCHEWNFMNQFNKSMKGFAGTHSFCRDCHIKSNAEYRKQLFPKGMES